MPTFPSLENLEYYPSGDQSDCIFVIAESSPLIKRFVGTYLDSSLLGFQEISDLLQLMPSLIEFACVESDDYPLNLSLDSRTIDMISRGDLVPKIENLELYFHSEVYDDDKQRYGKDMQSALVKMIESRCLMDCQSYALVRVNKSISRLRRLVLRGDVDPDLPVMYRVRAQGLEIEWKKALE